MGRRHCIALAFILAAIPVHVDAQLASFQLRNGVPVTVNTIEQADDIAMEVAYSVGFLHEPEGMVQASHLLEHLVCFSPCGYFADREAMKFLNEIGMANAETMPDFTHYDYAVPKKDFERIVKIEAQRLAGIRFNHAVVRREAKRCYKETDFVERSPRAGMLKHAFMAFSHAWRFHAERALVRGGMEDFSIERLQRFHSESYHPGRLSIAITGAISAYDARKTLDKHIGVIEAKHPQPARIDWTKVDARRTVHWDSKVRAICIAWEPPAKQSERTALSVLGLLAMQKLMADPKLNSKFAHVSCSNNIWPVGELPLFVYVTLKTDVDIEDAEPLLRDRFRSELAEACRTAATQLPQIAAQSKLRLTWEQTTIAARMLERQGKSKSSAIRMCLLQDSLNRIIRSRLVGSQPVNQDFKLDEDTLSRLVEKVTKNDLARVVQLAPLQDNTARVD